MKPKVIFQDVSKKYALYSKQSDKLMDILFSSSKSKSFYALRNVSFEIYEGETIGVIGINGSGKSTLSNLLAQVIPPTSGKIRINGHSSLIAISAGLNNQLSGIENIQLKCLMHGLKRDEIKKVMPQIIEFADIGDFIYQPVKNYSSGMKSRLGFAISVYTNPDILIIDEALSVGDQTFYNKCIEKIKEFKRAGKTIIFISHSLSQVKSMSDRVMWLHFGRIREFGPADQVIKDYQEFIKWFNGLDKEEQKRYRQEQLLKQQNEEPMNVEGDILKRLTRKRAKKKKRHFLGPMTFFLIYLFAVALMFADASLKHIEMYAKGLTERREAAPKEVKPSPVNREGVIIAETSPVFSDHQLNQKRFDVRFSEKVFIKEQIGDAVKIETSRGSGYVLKTDVEVTGSSLTASRLSMENFLPILPESFVQSYQYFFAFLNEEEGMIKQKLEGLTNEFVDESGYKHLVYQFDDLSYWINQEGKSEVIEVRNIKTDSGYFGELKRQATIVSKDQTLLYFAIDRFKVLINVKEKNAIFQPIS
ncbi:teichoic acids export ABC transporter ATP-binding subunit TagH [Geobacillus thermodenitrificans]|jgi:teichoic acid transport system ATP-binding protein|uniref:teichoic acids export ABC transporter ATP-binding subunit TagH n=1 Tax=Geobacillus thermodenitrificans TaxID=33940 RepID=UPI002E0C14D4|nr:teichoic acids export ABC transporter ATP-binding subunit TagH [Geobacillus thermodenitrificans]MEC5188054.1 teichoic acid transport system ATP-binding protein [Geobacillus thermodenitrificans]MED0663277.1 teichoic acids export ABC transporter ATP-binding subunit TagH [Geobacillus thermodenitrificans]